MGITKQQIYNPLQLLLLTRGSYTRFLIISYYGFMKCIALPLFCKPILTRVNERGITSSSETKMTSYWE
jgi:hypothetical protein